jgi:hypothetical protein
LTFKGKIGDKGFMSEELDLYEYPADHIGRKTYVSVRGHTRSIPKYKTYKGIGGHNYIHPDFGGDYSGLAGGSAFIMPDKAGYVSPMDCTLVEGRAAHREHMKRHGVLEAGDMKLGEFSGRERAPLPPVRHDIARAIQELESR